MSLVGSCLQGDGSAAWFSPLLRPSRLTRGGALSRRGRVNNMKLVHFVGGGRFSPDTASKLKPTPQKLTCLVSLRRQRRNVIS